MSNLENIYGKDRLIDTPVSEAAVTAAAIGASIGEQDGMLFRSEKTNALYISDSVHVKSSPVGGNFTRVGIGNRVENGIVAHVPMAQPTSKVLMNVSKNALEDLKIKYSFGGTYLAMEGPQFSSKAESLLYRNWNCDVIGMTNMPEAKLAREAEIRYASISMVTDYDSWSSEHDEVDLQMLLKTMHKNVEKSKKFIKNLSSKYYNGIDFTSDNTSTILDTSIVTQPNDWNKNTAEKLSNILKRFLKDSNASK